MSVEDITINKFNLKLGEKEIKLSLTMRGGMFLAKKYGSTVKAFKQFELLGKSNFELTVEQIDIICDMLFAMSSKVFETPEAVQESIDFANIKTVLVALSQAIVENLPKSEGGDGSTPQLP